jgi:small conductance mechanosensitive channel
LQTIEVVQQQLENRQLRNLNDIQRRLLQVGQVVLWGGGTFAILGLFPYTRWLQPLVLAGPLKVFGIGVITYVVIRASAVLIDRFFAALQDGEFLAPEASQRLALRVSTFSQISKSITAIGCIGVGGLVALSVVGVDVIPLLAGAGIIGLAISFASQSLIKDMINGFLILFEDQYAVGDVIVVDKVGGLVENMTLRITQLRDTEGKLITLPNGSITVVQNLSKDWSRVDLTIEVAYGADLDYALDVIKQVGQQMFSDRDWNGKILEQPDVLGVDKIEHTGILIRVWIKTQPLQQWSVGREFRRRLKNAFDQAGVAIGVPQQSLWFSNSLDMLAHRRLTNGDGHQPRQLIGHSDDAN